MKNLNLSSPPARYADVSPHVARDFKLLYFDLYPGESMTAHQPDPQLHVEATEEFPFLADGLCCRIVCAFTEERAEHHKVDVCKSNVPLQGWVERYARSAGMAGWTLPQGFMARMKFRWAVYRACTNALADEVFSDVGIR